MSELFWILAIVGSVLFGLRIVMMLVGFGHGDAGDTGDHHHGDGDFGWFSLQALSTLAMSVGWTGVLATDTWSLPTALAALVAVAGGFVATSLFIRLMRSLFKLQESGTMDLARAAGASGTVYLGIPAGGRGQVQVVVDERLITLEARAAGKDAIPTGTAITVHAVEGSGIAVVSPSWSPL